MEREPSHLNQDMHDLSTGMQIHKQIASFIVWICLSRVCSERVVDVGMHVCSLSGVPQILSNPCVMFTISPLLLIFSSNSQKANKHVSRHVELFL